MIVKQLLMVLSKSWIVTLPVIIVLAFQTNRLQNKIDWMKDQIDRQDTNLVDLIQHGVYNSLSEKSRRNQRIDLLPCRVDRNYVQ